MILLRIDVFRTVIHAIVITQLNYCNSHYIGNALIHHSETPADSECSNHIFISQQQ